MKKQNNLVLISKILAIKQKNPQLSLRILNILMLPIIF